MARRNGEYEVIILDVLLPGHGDFRDLPLRTMASTRRC